MKRLFLVLIPACMLLSSCGLINSLLGVGTTGTVANPIASGLATIAPNPRNLQAQEDRGTGLYGYLNEYGVWVISPVYRYAKDFNHDMGIAVVQLQNGYWGGIDVYAATVINFSFRSSYDVESAIRSIQKGRYRGIDLWECQDEATGLYGYLDYYGTWFIQPQYRYVCSMSEGYAVVQFQNELWGAINRSNQIVVQPNFTSRYDAESALRKVTR